MIVVEKKLIPAEILKFQSCCIWLLPIFQSGSDLNRRLNARRPAALFCLPSGAVPCSTRIRLLLFLPSTARLCIAASGR